MANIVFGEYKPTEIEEFDFSDPNIIDIEWLDENKNPIGTKTINGTDFSNIVYGQKVRVKVKFENYTDNRGIFISIESNNQKCKFKPKIPMMLVKNNEVLSEPFSLPINIYFDEIEDYDYVNHYTKVTNPQELYVSVLVTTTFKTEKRHILKPYTYFRNYEELIGLFKENGNGIKTNEYKPDKDPKKTIQNYEDKFINYNTQIAQIVGDFIKFINLEGLVINLDNEREELKDTKDENRKKELLKKIEEKKAFCIEDRVKIDAIKLWNSATTQVQGGKLDDRPLYWARNKMQTYLKRHPFFKNDIDYEKNQVKPNTKLSKIITLFEEKSRNYTGIDFSNVPAGSKKVLITGFDPFQLNPSYTFSGPETFNPSGIIAMFLNKNQELLSKDIYVQTCIFPVRYEDFDSECVEKVINKYFNDVDVIITTSLNGGDAWFDIEQNAIEYRGGGSDNMFIGSDTETIDGNSVVNNIKRFKVNKSSLHSFTTLPQDKIFGNKNNFKIIINSLDVNFDKSGLTSQTVGAGSNYLSNEVMYRATKVRDKIQIAVPLDNKKPVGHFHLANLNDINRMDEVLKVTIVVLKKATL